MEFIWTGTVAIEKRGVKKLTVPERLKTDVGTLIVGGW